MTSKRNLDSRPKNGSHDDQRISTKASKYREPPPIPVLGVSFDAGALRTRPEPRRDPAIGAARQLRRGCEDFLRSPEFGLTLTARLATPDAPKAAPDARRGGGAWAVARFRSCLKNGWLGSG